MNNHANPVGMTKDIYKITNNINGKIYIGQAKNSEYRFYTHCKPSNKDCLVDYAISKYGKENFTLEILESQVSNYNERERYWIKALNSKVPNGYNISDGGDNPPVFYGIHHPNASIKSQDVLNHIIFDLTFTSDSYNIIASRYKTNKKTIMCINNGTRYYNPSLKYPLRVIKNINGKLTEEDIDNIIEELKYSYDTNTNIGKHYGVSETTIRHINSGTTHHRDNLQYPIRSIDAVKSKLKYDEIMEIAYALSNTDISINQLSKKYNVNFSTIQNINVGSKVYFRRELTYPLRLPPYKKLQSPCNDYSRKEK